MYRLECTNIGELESARQQEMRRKIRSLSSTSRIEMSVTVSGHFSVFWQLDSTKRTIFFTALFFVRDGISDDDDARAVVGWAIIRGVAMMRRPQRRR